MANWAKIDDSNTVKEVLVVADDKDAAWLTDKLGGTWMQTSYNTRKGKHLQGETPFRGNFAGIGFTYDETLDAFLPPKPFESWVLDAEIFDWQAPVPMPQDEKAYRWDEDSTAWVEVTDSE